MNDRHRRHASPETDVGDEDPKFPNPTLRQRRSKTWQLIVQPLLTLCEMFPVNSDGRMGKDEDFRTVHPDL